MKIEVTLTLEIEDIEGQTTEDVFDIFSDYLTDCFYDHESVEKFYDFGIQRVDD